MITVEQIARQRARAEIEYDAAHIAVCGHALDGDAAARTVCIDREYPQLMHLARSVVQPAQAGGQGLITVEIDGYRWDTRRLVRVRQEWRAQDESEDGGVDTAWTGPLDTWTEAVMLAANELRSRLAGDRAGEEMVGRW